MSLRAAHHDGSERYVSTRSPSLDDRVTVWLRVPAAATAARVFVRTTPDAEPRFAAATIDHESAHETWWRAEVAMANPVMRYRFLLEGGVAPYRWLNATGTIERDVTDHGDFWLTTATAPPSWLDDAVVYQIFIDRFGPSDRPRHWPSWAVPSRWDEPIDPDWRVSTRQLFGGDLPGIERHLDHVIALGANVLYLTPFFPATSAHRYDASSFDHVDDLLGGDQGLIDLVTAAHRAGLRVLGDLTTNHTGDTHPWFRSAQADASSDEATMYVRDGDGFASWLGHSSLPKLDHRSALVSERMLVGPASVTGRWLADPVGLDGWRVDVANMTGRIGAVDQGHEVARAMRATIAQVRPDAWLLAEHCYDASRDLRGDGWHGTMNYSGIARPLWSWLHDPDSFVPSMGFPSPPPRIDGASMAATISDFVAAMPWRSTAASLTLLGTHDTARWATVAGDAATQLAGLAMLMVLPGVPCVYYGDEIGLEGRDGDAARAPMPWDESNWDNGVLDAYRRAIALRHGSSALQRGGLRWVHLADDCVVLLRESCDERVLVQVSRTDHTEVRLSASELGMVAVDGSLATLVSLFGHAHLTVVDDVITLPDGGPRVHAWRIEAPTGEGAS